MSQPTRTCHECRRELPSDAWHFKLVGRFGSLSRDRVCIECRKIIGARAWDVMNDNVSIEPASNEMLIPEVEVFPE